MSTDTEEIVAKWLQVCPPCDAGIGAPCTHPDEDYRPVMLLLVQEIERLRVIVGRCPRCGHQWSLHKPDSGDGVPYVCIGSGSMCPCQRRSDRLGLGPAPDVRERGVLDLEVGHA